MPECATCRQHKGINKFHGGQKKLAQPVCKDCFRMGATLPVNEPKNVTIQPREKTSGSHQSTPQDTVMKPVKLQDFELLSVIGQGAFGKVLLVRQTSTSQVFAMKAVSKKHLINQNNVMCMKAERDIMTKVRHPFVTSLVYAFQSDSKVYLVMDYHSGGELFSYLRKETLFTEEKARFYLAEMVLALAHLHSQGIVHRDLKPENILISAQGHIKLTDFGLAKQYREGDELLTVCGTDEYMAPEIILGKGYDGAVDWWSLGALAHEMMVGKPPFQSRSIRDLHTKILTAKLSLPKWLSPDAHALLKALLERNVTKRLGSGKSGMFATRGVEAIKTHPFFKSVDWNMLERLRIPAPFVPVHKHDADTSNFDKSVTQMAVTELHFDPAIDEDQNRLFVGFSFCGMSELQKSDLHRESTPPSPRQAATLSSE